MSVTRKHPRIGLEDDASAMDHDESVDSLVHGIRDARPASGCRNGMVPNPTTSVWGQ